MPSNKERAEFGAAVVNAQIDRDGSAGNDKEGLTDVLTNLMHYCDDEGPSFDDCLRMASMHHEAEVLEGDGLRAVFRPDDNVEVAADPSSRPNPRPHFQGVVQGGLHKLHDRFR